MTMLDERLRGADPAAGLREYSGQETVALLARIRADAADAAIAGSTGLHVASDRPEAGSTGGDAARLGERSGTDADVAAEVVDLRRRRPVRWIVLVAAIVLTVAMFLVPALLTGPGRTGATTAAADVLDRAKLAAADPPARPDQYWKTTVRSMDYDVDLGGHGGWSPGDPDTVAWMRQVERTTWVRVDGDGPTWILDRTGPYFWQAGGPPTALPVADWTVVGVAEETWTNERPQDGPDLAQLPTDPVALRDYLDEYVTAMIAESGGNEPSADERSALIASQAAQILLENHVPVELSRALFDVFTTMPRIDVIDPDTMFDGRRAVTLGVRGPYGYIREFPGFRFELVFDHETGRFLGERMIPPNEAAVDFPTYRELLDAIDPDVLAQAVKRECTNTETGTTCTMTIP